MIRYDDWENLTDHQKKFKDFDRFVEYMKGLEGVEEKEKELIEAEKEFIAVSEREIEEAVKLKKPENSEKPDFSHFTHHPNEGYSIIDFTTSIIKIFDQDLNKKKLTKDQVYIFIDLLEHLKTFPIFSRDKKTKTEFIPLFTSYIVYLKSITNNLHFSDSETSRKLANDVITKLQFVNYQKNYAFEEKLKKLGEKEILKNIQNSSRESNDHCGNKIGCHVWTLFHVISLNLRSLSGSKGDEQAKILVDLKNNLRTKNLLDLLQNYMNHFYYCKKCAANLQKEIPLLAEENSIFKEGG